MNLRHVIPTLATGHMDETVQFYTGKLGFKVVKEVGSNGHPEEVQLMRDEALLQFSLKSNPVFAGSSTALDVDSTNVENLFAELKNALDIIRPLSVDENGRKFFTVKDNNGYLISFGQMPAAKTSYQIHFGDDFVIETPRVRLRLMQMEDLDAFAAISGSPLIWKYFTKDLTDRAEMQQWMIEGLADRFAEKRMPFTIIDKDSHNIVGSTSYGNISFHDSRIEIGWSWLGVDYMGSGVNRHAKFALISYAFEVMKMERVEIKTDNLNERAKAALLKVGMIPEGVLRSHMQMHSNRRRDTIFFSIIRNEWPERKESFFSDMI